MKILNIVISHGQSLSQGTSSKGAVLSSPVGNGLMLDYNNDTLGIKGFRTAVATSAVGFTQLHEVRNETHVSGMVQTLSDSLGETWLNISLGAGGKSIATLSGAHYMNNLKQELKDVVKFAALEGYTLGKTAVFSFIQGQADSGAKQGYYEAALENLVDNVSSIVQNNLGAKTLTVLSQTRDYAKKEVALAQFEVSQQRTDVILGALEIEHQTKNPDVYAKAPTHLSAQGYKNLGIDMGQAVAAAMTGNEDEFIFIESVSRTGTTLRVKFSEQVRVDSTLFSATPEFLPKNYGFGTWELDGTSGDAPDILSVRKVSYDTFQVELADFTTPFSLWIGRGEENNNFGGTTLMDVVTHNYDVI